MSNPIVRNNVSTTLFIREGCGFKEVDSIPVGCIGVLIGQKDDFSCVDFVNIGKAWIETKSLDFIEPQNEINEDKTEIMPNSRAPFQSVCQVDEKAFAKAHFDNYAYTAQQFNSSLRLSRNWEKLRFHEREALEGILRNVAHIANSFEGDSRGWREIADFANLIQGNCDG